MQLRPDKVQTLLRKAPLAPVNLHRSTFPALLLNLCQTPEACSWLEELMSRTNPPGLSLKVTAAPCTQWSFADHTPILSSSPSFSPVCSQCPGFIPADLWEEKALPQSPRAL